MGFYSDKDMFDDNGKTPKSKSKAWRYLAVVVVSALVGSGTTAAIVPAMMRSGSVPTTSAAVVTGTSGAVPTSVSVNVNDGITSAVKQVEPAVMGVVNYARVTDFFSEQSKLQPAGVGTGVLVYKDSKYGYLVTNNHVVQNAAKVETVLTTGKHIQATVVGTDPYTDLAVLKIPLQYVKNITPAQFANSDTIQAGEPAIAIGTPMGLDFADSVTAGIVSAKQRTMPVEVPDTNQILDYQSVIQTDAAINPGNSGGPLINIDGKVIGINSSKIVAPHFEGMGFAIPSNEVRTIANEIMKTGHAVHPSLGIDGTSLVQMPQQFWPNVPVDYGVWIRSVTSTEAKQGGLQPQDVIVNIDGHDVKTMADLRTYLFQQKPGQVVTLRVYRNQQELTLKVKLGEAKGVNTTNTGLNAQPPGASSSTVPSTNPFGH